MRKQATTLVASMLAVFVLGQPLSALADSEGGKSSSSKSESRSGGGETRSSSRDDSRSGMGETRSGVRSESGERSDSRLGVSENTEHSRVKSKQDDDHFGHERGDGRRDWDEKRHQDDTAQDARRPAMTPEAAALMTQARKAAFEYRTTGSAASLAALQSLRASLIAMGFTRVPGRGTPAPASNTGTSSVAVAPATPGGTPSSSGVAVP